MMDSNGRMIPEHATELIGEHILPQAIHTHTPSLAATIGDTHDAEAALSPFSYHRGWEERDQGTILTDHLSPHSTHSTVAGVGTVLRGRPLESTSPMRPPLQFKSTNRKARVGNFDP